MGIQRRSSSRSIKRKKFADEVVESSLKYLHGSKYRGELPSTSTATTPQPEVRRRPMKPPSKRSRKSRSASNLVTKDIGRWKPADDLILITNVQQTCDLQTVYRGTKFSCRFTSQEIQERWYALLYDSTISKLAMAAMRMLYPEQISAIQAKALYSKAEEALLAKVKSTSQPNLNTFRQLLDENQQVFFVSRTPKALLTHWQLMKQYHLLLDQSVQPMPKGDHVLNFSDAEDLVNDADLTEPRDEVLEHELLVADRKVKREIRHLENELKKWQVLVDSVTGISPPDFDNQTLAVLRGRLVRYLMRSREISVGRSAPNFSVDVDLSLEGPAWKISRKQAVIKLRNNGDFFIANEGKRPVYIDGKPVLHGNKCKLSNNCVVEIAGLRFIFLINQDLINVIRQEATRMSIHSSV